MPGDDAVARAQVLLDLGRHREMVPLLQLALAEDPQARDAQGLLAQAWLGIGDHQAAKAVADTMIATRPDDEWGHRLRAVAFGRSGRHAQAMQAAEVAVRCAPHTYETHLTLARVTLANPLRLHEALAPARRAVTLAPNEPATHVTLALAASAVDDRALAREAYRTTLALDPSHAVARNNLTLLEDRHRIVPQARAYGAALQQDPTLEVARKNIEVLVGRVVLRIYLASLVAVLAASGVRLAGRSDGEPAPPGPITWAIGALLVVGIPCATVLVVRGMPRSVRRYGLRRLLGRPWMLVRLLLGVLILGFACAISFVPSVEPLTAGEVARFAFFGGVALAWGFSRRSG